MTLGEMIDEITEKVGRDLEHASVAKWLNRAQDREGRDLAIPQFYAEVTDVTAAFQLPAGARREGLLEVRHNTSGSKYPIFNTMEADLRYPGWKEWDPGSTRFIVFDPKMTGASGLITPVPLPKSGSAQDYYITYTTVPNEMTSVDDEPWDGQLPSYHEVVMLRVLFEAMIDTGDDRWQPNYQRYTKLKGDAFDTARPFVYTGNNLIYQEVMNAGTS